MSRSLVKCYFWVYLWGCFWKRLDLTGRLSKTGCPPQCGWASCNLPRVWIEQKEWGRCIHCLFLSWDIRLLLPSNIADPCSWAFRFLDLHHQLPRFSGLCTLTESHCGLSWFPSLQTANCGASLSPLACEPIAMINLLLYMSLHSSCWSLESPEHLRACSSPWHLVALCLWDATSWSRF